MATIDACEKLVDLHAWPTGRVDVEGWLKNFDDHERGYAVYMLSKFMFFSDEIVNALFVSAFQDLSNIVRKNSIGRTLVNRCWNNFLNQSFVTLVQGEAPSPSDSGFLFARKARQLIGIPEEQVVNPDQTLDNVFSGFNGPIVFVDDFVGSGNQFVRTFTQKRSIGKYGLQSFDSMPDLNNRLIIYCSSMMTQRGIDRIKSECPSVKLITGNIISDLYNWTLPDSNLWPDEIRSKGIDFIKRNSEKIGFKSDDGGEMDWQGFHKLGLGLAFEHSTPDATLPIFYSNNNGWCPLVTRT